MGSDPLDCLVCISMCALHMGSDPLDCLVRIQMYCECIWCRLDRINKKSLRQAIFAEAAAMRLNLEGSAFFVLAFIWRVNRAVGKRIFV